MNCYRVKDRMVPYMKGSVEPYEKKEIAEHLEGCATCKEEYVSLLMKRDFGSTPTFYHDPETAPVKIPFQDRLFPEGRIGRNFWPLFLGRGRRALVPLLITALLLAGVALMPRNPVRPLTLNDFLQQHKRATFFFQYKKYTLTSLADFSKRLPMARGYFDGDIRDPQFTFLGGEVLMVHGNPVGHAVGRYGKGFISFFVAAGDPAPLLEEEKFLPLGKRELWTAESGRNRIWLRSHPGNYMLIVSGLSPAELPPFSELLK